MHFNQWDMYHYPLLFLNSKVERLDRFSFFRALGLSNQKGGFKITVTINPFTHIKLTAIINIHDQKKYTPVSSYCFCWNKCILIRWLVFTICFYLIKKNPSNIRNIVEQQMPTMKSVSDIHKILSIYSHFSCVQILLYRLKGSEN